MRLVRTLALWQAIVLSACQSAAPVAQEPTPGAPSSVAGTTVGAAAPALGIDLRVPPTRAPRSSASPVAAPPANPGAVVLASPGTSVSITLGDNGRTITLHPGQRALVSLGDELDWNVRVDDESIVSHVPGVTVVRGAQGLYQANRVGQTALTATGDAACRTAQPACEQPSRTFKLTITVQ